MGVTGLWTVLQPCARPIKIETLNKKRLAVDASIWIYQFLKAVRDKEGNALRNSHIVGFFRRICKLLFFGIKPVFVFDGGAPALKRQTISNRKSRREGRREDAVRTAGKLLALQMQRAAEEDERKRKEAAQHPREEPEEDIPENIVYAEEILQTQQERQQNRKFKKKDQYHLPDLGVSLSEMGAANDPRIMSLEELEEYARQFDRGEDINVYDFSKIDFDSPFFVSLPASDRYNILNAARLRSRLRMGYSKEQLDAMFPDRMAFSRFQIERVRERNDLTQRLMNINGMADDSMFGANMTNRVASDKGREYVLVKNDGVEGGWALGVVTDKDEGKANKPIDVDRLPRSQAEIEEWEDEEDEFEDVPIEGLNRLPKPKPGMTAQDMEGREFLSQELAKRRQRFYNASKNRSARPKTRRTLPINPDPDSLFLAEEDGDGQWEDVPVENDEFLRVDANDTVNEEEEHLRQAIALSLNQNAEVSTEDKEDEEEEDIYREVFPQEKAQEMRSLASANGSGLAIAKLANQRSGKLAKATPVGAGDSDDDDMDLQAALAESRKTKRATSSKRPISQTVTDPPHSKLQPSRPTASTTALGFDGPLPFEKLNLGNSLLGKRKMQAMEQDTGGGFERDLAPEKKKAEEPLPPWFTGNRDIQEELAAQQKEETHEWEQARKVHEEQSQNQQVSRLRTQGSHEVIDLEASSTQEEPRGVVVLESSDADDVSMVDVPVDSQKLQMSSFADRGRVHSPGPLSEGEQAPPKQQAIAARAPFLGDSDDESIEWSDSQPETGRPIAAETKAVTETDLVEPEAPQSSSPEFEEVQIHPQAAMSPPSEFENVPTQMDAQQTQRRNPSPMILEGPDELDAPLVPQNGIIDDGGPPEFPDDDDEDQYSDPEDAELFASLAAEAEEHARFAQELNNNNTARINFEEELKQLRVQQKKDRRDADEVTQTMISECQHLLTLFGLPYVTAPMEAEAQCAELVSLGLVDGIVTDDSDTFLFGGTRVYKNMFNAAKFVECYLANDFTTEFSLTREKLIAIAQLLGSDYTTGIPGIGPVTALEILSEFGDLQSFRDWWTGVQNGTVSKEEDKASQFRRRFRRSQASKLFLPTMFPNAQVADAYLHPGVDDDPQPFQWGIPDLDALRTFLSTQIGWSTERTDEVLVPVIRDMNRREKEGTQSNITRYFDGTVGAGSFAPRVRGDAGPSGKKKGKGAAGKRLGAALTKLAHKEGGRGGEREDHGVGEELAAEVSGAEAVQADEGSKRTRKRATKRKTNNEGSYTGSNDDDNDLYEEPKKRARKSGKSK